MKKVKKFLQENWKKILIISIILILDIITKLFFEGKFIDVINGFFSFNSSHNTGAAFSIFSGNVWLLIAFTIVFLIIMTVYDIKFKSNSKLYMLSISFIFGGALGNLFDRIFLGYVRDFISFDFINFPIFNVADIFLTIGTILLIIYLLFVSKGEKNVKNN